MCTCKYAYLFFHVLSSLHFLLPSFSLLLPSPITLFLLSYLHLFLLASFPLPLREDGGGRKEKGKAPCPSSSSTFPVPFPLFLLIPYPFPLSPSLYPLALPPPPRNPSPLLPPTGSPEDASVHPDRQASIESWGGIWSAYAGGASTARGGKRGGGGRDGGRGRVEGGLGRGGRGERGRWVERELEEIAGELGVKVERVGEDWRRIGK